MASGLNITGVQIDETGRITVLVGDSKSIQDATHSANEWDSV
jgi:hypothetical protein